MGCWSLVLLNLSLNLGKLAVSRVELILCHEKAASVVCVTFVLDAPVHELLQSGVGFLLISWWRLHLLDTSVAYLGQLPGTLLVHGVDALNL